MTQETSGADQNINPPSFVPSAGRRQRPSASAPQSFAPARSRATGAAGAHRSGDDAAEASPARSASPGDGSSADSVTSSSQHAVGATTPPPSFSPNARRAARRSTPGDAMPQSIAPTRARRSSGSSRNAARPASTPANPQMSRPAAASLRAGRGSVSPGAGVARAVRPRHRAGRIAAIAVAVLIAALVVSVFGAWTWVNGRLNKADWLTDSADTPASTWLILGSDERDGSTDYGGVDDVSGYRTDTILVLTKPKSGASSLISIPRDSLMNVDGQYMKINSVAQFAGNKALVGEIETLTGQRIDHVAQIKFGGLQEVVNALGGIELCYDQDVQDAYSGLNWKAGCHTADGATALSFSRMRYADAQGDFGRNARQRQVIAAIVKKASSAQTLTNPAKVSKLANAGLDSLTVDNKTTPFTLLSMALAFKDATGSNGISGSVYWSDPDYYVDGVGSSVLLDDAKNTELFSELAAGTHAAGTVGTLAES